MRRIVDDSFGKAVFSDESLISGLDRSVYEYHPDEKTSEALYREAAVTRRNLKSAVGATLYQCCGAREGIADRPGVHKFTKEALSDTPNLSDRAKRIMLSGKEIAASVNPVAGVKNFGRSIYNLGVMAVATIMKTTSDASLEAIATNLDDKSIASEEFLKRNLSTENDWVTGRRKGKDYLIQERAFRRDDYNNRLLRKFKSLRSDLTLEKFEEYIAPYLLDFDKANLFECERARIDAAQNYFKANFPGKVITIRDEMSFINCFKLDNTEKEKNQYYEVYKNLISESESNETIGRQTYTAFNYETANDPGFQAFLKAFKVDKDKEIDNQSVHYKIFMQQVKHFEWDDAKEPKNQPLPTFIQTVGDSFSNRSTYYHDRELMMECRNLMATIYTNSNNPDAFKNAWESAKKQIEDCGYSSNYKAFKTMQTMMTTALNEHAQQLDNHKKSEIQALNLQVTQALKQQEPYSEKTIKNSRPRVRELLEDNGLAQYCVGTREVDDETSSTSSEDGYNEYGYNDLAALSKVLVYQDLVPDISGSNEQYTNTADKSEGLIKLGLLSRLVGLPKSITTKYLNREERVFLFQDYFSLVNKSKDLSYNEQHELLKEAARNLGLINIFNLSGSKDNYMRWAVGIVGTAISLFILPFLPFYTFLFVRGRANRALNDLRFQRMLSQVPSDLIVATAKITGPAKTFFGLVLGTGLFTLPGYIVGAGLSIVAFPLYTLYRVINRQPVSSTKWIYRYAVGANRLGYIIGDVFLRRTLYIKGASFLWYGVTSVVMPLVTATLSVVSIIPAVLFDVVSLRVSNTPRAIVRAYKRVVSPFRAGYKLLKDAMRYISATPSKTNAGADGINSPHATVSNPLRNSGSDDMSNDSAIDGSYNVTSDISQRQSSKPSFLAAGIWFMASAAKDAINQVGAVNTHLTKSLADCCRLVLVHEGSTAQGAIQRERLIWNEQLVRMVGQKITVGWKATFNRHFNEIKQRLLNDTSQSDAFTQISDASVACNKVYEAMSMYFPDNRMNNQFFSQNQGIAAKEFSKEVEAYMRFTLGLDTKCPFSDKFINYVIEKNLDPRIIDSNPTSKEFKRQCVTDFFIHRNKGGVALEGKRAQSFAEFYNERYLSDVSRIHFAKEPLGGSVSLNSAGLFSQPPRNKSIADLINAISNSLEVAEEGNKLYPLCQQFQNVLWVQGDDINDFIKTTITSVIEEDSNTWSTDNIEKLTTYLKSTESQDASAGQQGQALLAKLESALKDVSKVNNDTKGQKP